MVQKNYWPHTGTIIRVFVGIVLAFAFLFLPQHVSAHNSISSADGPTISNLKLGFTNGDYRDGNWIPVQVLLSNNGADFNGKVSLAVPSPFTGINNLNSTQSTYQAPVNLPGGAQKQVTLYIPLNLGAQGTPQTISVDLLNSSGQKVATSSGTINSISANDIFVGVLSDQPAGNFSLLNGVTMSNSAVRVNEEPLDATTFPAIPEVLKNFDIIVLDNFTTSKLNQEQLATLRDWVNQGGTLIEVGGPEWHRTLGALPGSLLPVTITGTDSLAPKTHLLPIGGPTKGSQASSPTSDTLNSSVAVSAATPQAGSSVILASGNIPLITQAYRGQGQVYYLAFDPTLDPLVNWANTSNLWKGLIFRAVGDHALGNNSTYSIATSKLGVYGASGIEGLIQLLFPNSYPAIWIILALLLGYILVLGPVRLLLVRQLKNRDWSWRIVLTTILIFSLLSYGLALQQKGTSIMSGSISITQLSQPDASGSTEHVTSYVGVYVPSQGDFQVHIPGFSLVQPTTQAQYYTISNQTGSQTQHTVITSQQDSTDVDLQGVDIWTMRTLVSQHSQHTQGGVSSHLTLQNNTIIGTITNSLPYDIKDAYVLAGTDFVPVGDLLSGKTRQINLQLTNSLNSSPFNNTAQTSIADQIASSHGLNPPVNPYADNSQTSSELRQHMAMLAALSGELYAYPCGGGSCYQVAPLGVANNAIIIRNSVGFSGGILRQATRDPLLVPGSPVTLIGWSANNPSDAANRITINGNSMVGAQEDYIQAPLNLDFSGPVNVPPGMVNSQLIDAQGQTNNSIQQTFPGTYSLTTGSMTFEFTLPNMPRLQNSSLTFNEPANLTRGVPYGGGPINDVNHIHVYLYNWQTGSWDSVSFNQFSLQVQDSRPYIGPGGRVLLQFANQDSSQGTTILTSPTLQLQGTVSG